jgi:ribulose-phosphate 3-epimerase
LLTALAGAAQFTFHIEAPGVDFCCNTAAALAARARQLGMLAGIALTPETSADAVLPLCATGAVDTVLLLSVRPGFGGQKFQPGVLPKVAALRAAGFSGNIIVDGGITQDNALSVAQAGANALVAGTTVFAGKEPPEAAVPSLVEMIAAGRSEWPPAPAPATATATAAV